MYGSWDTEWDRQNYLSFWAIFCPFTPQTIWRYYHSGDIITLYLCTINDNHMMYASRDMECDRQNVIFLSFWTVFCPLPPTPPPPNKLKNENFEKWKTLLEISSFYTCVPQKWHSNDVWFLRYGARQIEFFVILIGFLPFYHPNDSENQNFQKMKKNLEILSFYKCVP